MGLVNFFTGPLYYFTRAFKIHHFWKIIHILGKINGKVKTNLSSPRALSETLSAEIFKLFFHWSAWYNIKFLLLIFSSLKFWSWSPKFRTRVEWRPALRFEWRGSQSDHYNLRGENFVVKNICSLINKYNLIIFYSLYLNFNTVAEISM